VAGVIGAPLGYPGWFVDPHNPPPPISPLRHSSDVVFFSPLRATRWPAEGWLTGVCHALEPKVPHGPVPDSQCKCGIYAVRSPFEALAYVRHPLSFQTDFRLVARVDLAGAVIPGTRGFRAECARIRALVAFDEEWNEYPARSYVEELAQRARLDVELVEVNGSLEEAFEAALASNLAATLSLASVQLQEAMRAMGKAFANAALPLAAALGKSRLRRECRRPPDSLVALGLALRAHSDRRGQPRPPNASSPSRARRASAREPP
jgi:hypothetical protein